MRDDVPPLGIGVLRRDDVRSSDVADVADDRGAARGLALDHALDIRDRDAPAAIRRGRERRPQYEVRVYGDEVDPFGFCDLPRFFLRHDLGEVVGLAVGYGARFL